jgi:uncharacterized protein YbjT (DUF2867 family)
MYAMKQIFITGGTGYMGSRLIKILLAKEYKVKALVRKSSENKLPEGCDFVIANPFDAESFAKEIPASATFIQLLGVTHPSPKKKEQFKIIDLASAKASACAAQKAGVKHFIYVSVAQPPTNIMKDYQQCRADGEACIRATKIPVTFIRPWYVVGPDHYWPLLFSPLFKILEWIPSTSQKAKALRLVSLKQMLNTLMYAVENDPKENVNIIEIESIRKMRSL